MLSMIKNWSHFFLSIKKYYFDFMTYLYITKCSNWNDCLSKLHPTNRYLSPLIVCLKHLIWCLKLLKAFFMKLLEPWKIMTLYLVLATRSFWKSYKISSNLSFSELARVAHSISAANITSSSCFPIRHYTILNHKAIPHNQHFYLHLPLPYNFLYVLSLLGRLRFL